MISKGHPNNEDGENGQGCHGKGDIERPIPGGKPGGDGPAGDGAAGCVSVSWACQGIPEKEKRRKVHIHIVHHLEVKDITEARSRGKVGQRAPLNVKDELVHWGPEKTWVLVLACSEYFQRGMWMSRRKSLHVPCTYDVYAHLLQAGRGGVHQPKTQIVKSQKPWSAKWLNEPVSAAQRAVLEYQGSA